MVIGANRETFRKVGAGGGAAKTCVTLFGNKNSMKPCIKTEILRILNNVLVPEFVDVTTKIMKTNLLTQSP